MEPPFYLLRGRDKTFEFEYGILWFYLSLIAWCVLEHPEKDAVKRSYGSNDKRQIIVNKDPFVLSKYIRGVENIWSHHFIF